MASHDERKAGNLVSDFTDDKKFKDYETPLKRLRKAGFKKGRIEFVEATAIQVVSDRNLVGSHFALEFTSSSEHQELFFGKDREEYDRAGFAVAKSAKYPNTYYGCAVFVKR
jgi:hypothetical protein